MPTPATAATDAEVRGLSLAASNAFSTMADGCMPLIIPGGFIRERGKGRDIDRDKDRQTWRDRERGNREPPRHTLCEVTGFDQMELFFSQHILFENGQPLITRWLQLLLRVGKTHLA